MFCKEEKKVYNYKELLENLCHDEMTGDLVKPYFASPYNSLTGAISIGQDVVQFKMIANKKEPDVAPKNAKYLKILHEDQTYPMTIFIECIRTLDFENATVHEPLLSKEGIKFETYLTFDTCEAEFSFTDYKHNLIIDHCGTAVDATLMAVASLEKPVDIYASEQFISEHQSMFWVVKNHCVGEVINNSTDLLRKMRFSGGRTFLVFDEPSAINACGFDKNTVFYYGTDIKETPSLLSSFEQIMTIRVKQGNIGEAEIIKKGIRDLGYFKNDRHFIFLTNTPEQREGIGDYVCFEYADVENYHHNKISENDFHSWLGIFRNQFYNPSAFEALLSYGEKEGIRIPECSFDIHRLRGRYEESEVAVAKRYLEEDHAKLFQRQCAMYDRKDYFWHFFLPAIYFLPDTKLRSKCIDTIVNEDKASIFALLYEISLLHGSILEEESYTSGYENFIDYALTSVFPRYLPEVKEFRNSEGDGIGVFAYQVDERHSLKLVDLICAVNKDSFNYANSTGRLPVCLWNSEEYIREFIKRTGVNINNRNVDGATVLYDYGMLEEGKVRALIESGLDASIYEYPGKNSQVSSKHTDFRYSSGLNSNNPLFDQALKEELKDCRGTYIFGLMESFEHKDENCHAVFKKAIELIDPDIVVKDFRGETVLHKIVAKMHKFSFDELTMVKEKLPALMKIKNKEGLLPYQMLVRNFILSESQMLEILRILNCNVEADSAATAKYHNMVYESAVRQFLNERV